MADKVPGQRAARRRQNRYQRDLEAALGRPASPPERMLLAQAAALLYKAEQPDTDVAVAIRASRQVTKLLADLGIDLASANGKIMRTRHGPRHQPTVTPTPVEDQDQDYAEADLLPDDEYWVEVFSAFAIAIYGDPEIGDELQLYDGTRCRVLEGERLLRLSPPPRPEPVRREKIRRERAKVRPRRRAALREDRSQ